MNAEERLSIRSRSDLQMAQAQGSIELVTGEGLPLMDTKRAAETALLAFIILVAAAACFLRSTTRPSLSIMDIKNTFARYCYFIRGPEQIDHHYQKAGAKPFWIVTPSNSHVMITSTEDIRRMNDASTRALSLHAAAKEWLQPRYTMNGFEWHDTRGIEGTGFVRTLRSLLPSRLPQLVPTLQKTLEENFKRTFVPTEKSRGNLPSDRGILAFATIADDVAECRVNIFPSMKYIIARTNCHMFFGAALSQDQTFNEVALQYAEDVVFTAEAVRLVPQVLAPLVAKLLTRGHRAESALYRILVPEVESRMRIRDEEMCRGSPFDNRPADCMQWIIDTSPRKNPWSSCRMIGEIMAVWFGTVHQLPMSATYAIRDLARHPEYYEPLRCEALYGDSIASMPQSQLPLLDSFLLESARLSCADAVSSRRKALASHELSDGTRVSAGDWVCVPQRPMMRDPRIFSCPLTFDGFRFVAEHEMPTLDPSMTRGRSSGGLHDHPMRYTDLSDRAIWWGTGKTACPGRFYASTLLKLIMGHILKNYECPKIDSDTPFSFHWRTVIMPRNDSTVLFRLRDPTPGTMTGQYGEAGRKSM